MTPLPRSLAVQNSIIVLFIMLVAVQIYLILSTPGGMNLSRFAQIATPLGCLSIFTADHPKFKQTAAKIPLFTIGIALLIASIYINLVHRFS